MATFLNILDNTNVTIHNDGTLPLGLQGRLLNGTASLNEVKRKVKGGRHGSVMVSVGFYQRDDGEMELMAPAGISPDLLGELRSSASQFKRKMDTVSRLRAKLAARK